MGCCLITCVDREYCKKLIVQFPGQAHPEHAHQEKEETFEVLSGEFILMLNGMRLVMRPGDSQTILPGQWHGFTTDTGCIVEEISTRYVANGSVYRPGDIRCVDRKTQIALV